MDLMCYDDPDLTIMSTAIREEQETRARILFEALAKQEREKEQDKAFARQEKMINLLGSKALECLRDPKYQYALNAKDKFNVNDAAELHEITDKLIKVLLENDVYF